MKTEKGISKMRVLVVGGGGREHAICWALKREGATVWCAPGNPGIATLAECVAIDPTDFSTLVTFVREHQIELTVVGPEAPLSRGIVDEFRRAQLPIVGPSQAAAQLESSKIFSKSVMEKAGIPTARAVVCKTPQEVRAAITSYPAVVKADGLAAGKGVVIPQSPTELEQSLEFLFQTLKCDSVLVEEYLDGVEATFIVATDSVNVRVLPTAHDYKRLMARDLGPNTGGMGSISPTPRLTPADEVWVVEHVVKPVLAQMRESGTPFTGFLYCGLMIPRDPSERPDGIRVLEFNARLGDPECQAILSRLDHGFLPLLVEMGRRPNGATEPLPELRISDHSAACVVIASRGYPERTSEPEPITGLELAAQQPDTVVFHAGTAMGAKGEVVASGGRVLGVTARGLSRDEAIKKAYRCVDLIQFAGARSRRDIGR
jgi:phosphoribosylamine--glycine ligase